MEMVHGPIFSAIITNVLDSTKLKLLAKLRFEVVSSKWNVIVISF